MVTGLHSSDVYAQNLYFSYITKVQLTPTIYAAVLQACFANYS